MAPIIGITSDLHEARNRVGAAYAIAVVKAGGTPVILPPIAGLETHFLSICDGFVFTGGDDPHMARWGVSTHPNAKIVPKQRQEFELTLLEQLQSVPEIPVLGVCLGMQWMGLLAGGTLEQDLPSPLAENHADVDHAIQGTIGSGAVHSHHHQALTSAGNLTVTARAEDGVIEAIEDRTRAWYVGVQWHPERMDDCALGQELFNHLVMTAKSGVTT
jgi:gamma-glutamyl-gamma-aminobutyrate hydrolase PuuD